jgi:hypothetical protein
MGILFREDLGRDALSSQHFGLALLGLVRPSPPTQLHVKPMQVKRRANMLPLQVRMIRGIGLARNSGEALAADRVERSVRISAVRKSCLEDCLMFLHALNVAELLDHGNHAINKNSRGETAVSTSRFSRSIFLPADRGKKNFAHEILVHHQ